MYISGISGSTLLLVRRLQSALQHCTNAKGLILEIQYKNDIIIMIKTTVGISFRLFEGFLPFAGKAKNDRFLKYKKTAAWNMRIVYK
jgi:hypothetical protein